MANETPDYTPGVGRLATDRYDFQDHIEGTEFRHNAYSIDVNPPVVIASVPYIDVADALYALAAHGGGGGGGGFVVTGTGVVYATSSTTGTGSLGSFGQALFTNSGASGIVWSGFSGDVTSDALPGVLSVVKIQGNPVSGITPSSGQVLTWNTSTGWTPTTGVSGVTWANDLAGSTNTSQTVVGIQSHPVSATAPTVNGQLFEWGGSAWQPTASSPSPSVNNVLTWNGTSWAPAAPGGGGLTITGSGFIHVTSGTIDGAASHGSAGQVAITNTTPDATWQTISGDVRSSAISIGDFSVISINGATVPVGGSLTTGNVLQVTGGSSLSYAPVNLSGGGNYVIGTLPLANLAHGTSGTFLISNGSAPTWVSLTGNGTDITWNSSNPIGDLTVTGIQGNPVSSTPSPTAGQFLIENTSANGSSWQSLAGDVKNLSPTSSSNSLTVVGIQNHAVNQFATYTGGYVLTWNSTSNYWDVQPPAAGGTGITALTTTSTGAATETGDVTTVGQPSPVSGAQPATVIGLQGYKVSNVTPNTYNLLTYNATSGWAPGTVALGQGSLAVSGTLPLANGGIGQSSAPGAGYLLESNSTSTTTWLAPGSSGYVLTISGGVPSWQPPASGSSGITLEWNGNTLGSGFTNLDFVGAVQTYGVTGTPPYGYIYAWTQGGNSFALNPAIIGTNDNNEFDIYTDATQRIRVGNTGQVIVNAANSGLVTFTANGAASAYTIQATGNTSSGYGIYSTASVNAGYFSSSSNTGPTVQIQSAGASLSTPPIDGALYVEQQQGCAVYSSVSAGHGATGDLAYYGISDGEYVEYMYNNNEGIASLLQTSNTSTSTTASGSTGTCLKLVTQAPAGTASNPSQAHFIDFYVSGGTYNGCLASQSSTAPPMLYATSDRRLKENIKPTPLNIKLLDKIKIVEYNYISDPNVIRQGFIAQELYKVIPDAVIKGGDDPEKDPWMIAPAELIPLLVKSIQDLSKKVKSLEEDLYEFRDR
jgi:hypothetical protein